MERRIFVTGGTGMIGANLIRRMVVQGAHPYVLVRPAKPSLRLETVSDSIRIVEGDLANPDSINRVIDHVQPDVVFHLASTYFNPPTLTAREHFVVNALGTQCLLETLKKARDVRVIYLGSAAVYADGANLKEEAALEPSTTYGASKAAASVIGRTYARLYQTRFTELRLFSAFGPWERTQRLIPYTILSALSGNEIQISNGAQQRDFLYVDDVLDALLLAAATSLEPGSVLNICSGTGRSVQETVDTILQIMGNDVPVRVGSMPTRKDEIWKTSGDRTAAEKVLGWTPRTSFHDGLRKTVAWFKENSSLAGSLA